MHPNELMGQMQGTPQMVNPFAQPAVPQPPTQAPINAMKHKDFLRSLMAAAERIPDIDPGAPLISKYEMKGKTKHEGHRS